MLRRTYHIDLAKTNMFKEQYKNNFKFISERMGTKPGHTGLALSDIEELR